MRLRIDGQAQVSLYPDGRTSALNRTSQPARVTGFELFDHDADVGVRGFGRSLAEAFEQAALALTAISTDPADIRQDCAVEIECHDPDPELLFVDWLNAVIYEGAARNLLFGRFEVAIEGENLRARLFGETVNQERHRPAAEPKGATYTQLRIERDHDGNYMAQCVVDV